MRHSSRVFRRRRNLQHVSTTASSVLVELAAAGIEQIGRQCEQAAAAMIARACRHRHCARAQGKATPVEVASATSFGQRRIFYAGNPADRTAERLTYRKRASRATRKVPDVANATPGRQPSIL